MNLTLTKEEIIELKELIAEQNAEGLMVEIETDTPKDGALGGVDYLDIIKLVLGSGVVKEIVKGLFDLIKAYFKKKESESKANSKLEIAKINAQKIEVVVKKVKGKKEIKIKLHSFDEEERKTYNEAIDKILK